METQKDLSGDISGHSLHIADAATDNYERDFNISLVSNERKLLLSIDEALERIDNKTYGVCQGCTKLIVKSRLDAIPYAKYCKRCKEKVEDGSRDDL